MPYTLGEAARAVGRSKATLQEAIRKGRVSAAKDEFGRYRIEPVELHRVYPPATRPASEPDVAAPLPLPPDAVAELARLEERVAGLSRLCRQLEDERDSLRVQNARLTALLAPAPALPSPARIVLGRLWRRFLAPSRV